MPLTLVEPGIEYEIKRITGRPEIRQHLLDLGFVPGEPVLLISTNMGNVIVKVKNVRVAVSTEIAKKILI